MVSQAKTLRPKKKKQLSCLMCLKLIDFVVHLKKIPHIS